jgi:D-inositol-3-phosphate glycosyltransferase
MNVYVRELALALEALGHRVDLFTRSHGSGHEEVWPLGADTRLVHLRAGWDGPLPKTEVFGLLPGFARSLESFRGRYKRRYDLVHSHYWLSGWVGRWAAARWGVPHVMMFHTLGAVKNAIGAGPTEPALRLNAEKVLIESSHHVVVATDREGREMLEAYGVGPSSLSVVPCGVNLDLFKPQDRLEARRSLGLSPEETVFLYVGRFDPIKGLDRLLEAGAILTDSRSFRLLVVGGDDRQHETRRLQSLAWAAGLRGMTEFVGRVAHEDLPRYYNAADAFVLPSYHESFGMAALESLACGTPVIAGPVGGLTEILSLEGCGCLVEGGSASALARAMEAFLDLPARERRSPHDIRSAVTRFTWSCIARAIVDEYRRALINRSGPSGPSPGRPPVDLFRKAAGEK